MKSIAAMEKNGGCAPPSAGAPPRSDGAPPRSDGAPPRSDGAPPRSDGAPPRSAYPGLSKDFIAGRDYVFVRVKESFEKITKPLPRHYTPVEDFASPLKMGVQEFRDNYIFGSVKEKGAEDEIEEKTLISRGGIKSWPVKSSGLLWVGVNGTDSVCVVTKSDDLDMTRVTGSLTLQTIPDILTQFRKSAIVEIEDLADSCCGAHNLCDQITKPFGVVAVIPDDCKSHKGSRRKVLDVEYGKSMAIEFLQEKVDRVNGDTPFTVEETIQTAIVAFGKLIQKKLCADEIGVSVVDPKYKVHPSERKDPFMQDLTISEINKHLAAIKKLGTPAKRKFENEPCPNESSSGSRRLRARKRQ